MNQYPKWKYGLVLIAIFIGLIYSIPNFFGESPAVQIMPTKTSDKLDLSILGTIESALKEANLPFDGIVQEPNGIKVKFANPDTQVKAKDMLQNSLGPNYVIALNLISKSPSWLTKIGAIPMYLGLDLRGGVHFLLQVDIKAASEKAVESYLNDFRMTLRKERISYIGASRLNEIVKLQFDSQEELEKAKKIIKVNYPDLMMNESSSGKDKALDIGMSEMGKKRIQEFALKQNLQTLHNRINELGVAEPIIQQQGLDRIVVQLPGVKDINRAKDLIGRTAKLEFKIVNDTIPQATLNDWLLKAKEAKIEYKKGERFSDYVKGINEFLKNDLPKGFEIAFSKTMSKATNEITNLEPYLVESASLLTGDALQEAIVRIDQQENRPYVALEFKPNGAKLFEELTGANIGKRLAIVLDGNVYSAPMVQSKIAGGSAQITLGAGDYNALITEARDLALVLRAGALPVELVFEEQRIVGPSLGADAIGKAQFASMVGSLLVLVFMMIYYRMSGAIATATILVNVLFTLASLIAFGATLSLPGIAGIALTVGMAVDGNIIIYERIREEIRAGMTPFDAVRTGFDKAFWTIVDANLTTALAGLCLLNFGTGPVRGFAVTLLIGIVTTVYTSYFMSKVLFEIYVGKGDRKTLSI